MTEIRYTDDELEEIREAIAAGISPLIRCCGCMRKSLVNRHTLLCVDCQPEQHGADGHIIRSRRGVTHDGQVMG